MGAHVRGRSFSPEDSPDSPLVAVIDESLARRYWPGLDPIGQRFKGQDRRRQNDEWLEVIGVVNDMRRHGLERQATPHVYLSYSQSANATPDIVVRTAGSAAPLRGAVRQAVRSADRTAVLSDVTTLRDRLDQQLAPRRFRTWLLTLFSIVALLLAAIGIYGVMYYTVAQRRQEIGIRIALGARPADVVRMVVGHGLLLAVMGLTLGLAGAFGIAKVMASLLFGVSAFDVPAFTAAATLLLASACLASWIPARRASSINPVRAINAE
jgi:putative ABC transport system permease protein